MNASMSSNMIKKCLPGFEHIKRHWNDTQQSVVAIIEPGQFYITQNPELIMTTLGSCISACIRDPVTSIGGMNHFMLPVKGNIFDDKAQNISGAMRYGNWAMEYLINQLLKNGGKRRNLEVKLFGAGGSFDARSVCDLNIKFITDYIHDENLKLLAKDLGGPNPRTVIYNALTGKILMKQLVNKPLELIEAEKKYSKSIDKKDEGNDVQLF